MEDLLNLTYQNWYDKIIDAAGLHTKSNDELWDFWKLIEICLPDKYKLLLLLNCIYVENDNMTDEWLEYLADLVTNETDESKFIRMEENLKMIEFIYHMDGFELVDDDGYIEIHRGVHSSSDNWLGQYGASRDIQHALSYSYDKLVAQFFAIRFQADECSVITGKIHVDDVLAIHIDRHESEIIIKPPCLGGKLQNVTVETIIPSMKVMQQFHENKRVS